MNLSEEQKKAIEKEAEEMYPVKGRNPNWSAINNLREGYMAAATKYAGAIACSTASDPDAGKMKRSLEIMTALCRIKYGNLDKDVYEEIEKAEEVLASSGTAIEGRRDQSDQEFYKKIYERLIRVSVNEYRQFAEDGILDAQGSLFKALKEISTMSARGERVKGEQQ